MRKIDADRLKDAIYMDFWEHFTQCHDSDQTALIDMVMDDIDEMPTLTPPNEPLTIEQLREMDGEPVWIEDVKHWALIDIEKGGKWDGVPFVIWAENGAKFTYNVESRGWHCYRRPPEGEEALDE